MVRSLAGVCLALVTACNFDVTLGAEDGVAQVRYEETLTGLPADLARAPDGDLRLSNTRGDAMTATLTTAPDGSRGLSIPRTLEVYSADQSARELAKRGPDQIGALRGVRLTRVTAQIDGLDPTRVAGPTLLIGSRTLAPADDGVDLDDDTVNTIRVDLLTPQAVRIPMVFTLSIPASAPGALGSSLHISLVFQPLLTIDATRAL